jgi:glucosamine kinase
MPDQSHPPILPRNPAPAAARWLVGFDGGGTHTRARLASRDGRVLAQGRAGPSALGQGVAQSWRHLRQALDDAAHQAGMAPPPWHDCAVGAGLSGACMPMQAQAFVQADPGCAALALDSDGFAGVLGAHGGGPGALLVGGTGSVCEALRADGTRACAGGWGWRLGDEGSGAWLGQQALRHAQHALDGRELAGTLAQALWREIGADANALLAWAATADQRAFAALAPNVFAHGATDPHARNLLDRAATELEALAQAVDPEGTLPLAVAGSVAERLVARWSPARRARLVPPRADASAGALAMIRAVIDRTPGTP